MQQLSPDDHSIPFNKEQHLAWIACIVIGLLEIGLNQHADLLKISDLKCIQEASNLLSPSGELKSTDLAACEMLKQIGGLDLYKEIALEMREWIFIYEPAVLRKSKDRLEQKDDGSNDWLYLQEAYTALSDLFRRNSFEIKAYLNDLRKEDINLGMLREHMKTGRCEAPLIKPEVLASRYAEMFQTYQHKVKDLHLKLGNFRNYVQQVDLQFLVDQGLSGLRAIWSQNSLIVDRIYLQYLGIPEKGNQIFKQAFISKIQSNISKQKQNDDGNLYHYVKHVNDFLIRIKQSKDYNGTPEIEVALCAYVGNEVEG